MKKTNPFISVLLMIITIAGFGQKSALGQETELDTIRNEKVRVDTVWIEKVKVDTVIIEKARVDTVRIETIRGEPKQEPVQQSAEKAQKDQSKNDKVYYGGYANFSFGKYTNIGFEPLIAYKLLPRFSIGAKLSYEYVKDKRYDSVQEFSNFGASIFSRLRIARKLYAHIEYAGRNYKLYDSLGGSKRQWVPFLYLGGGYSLSISKKASLNAQVLWDLLQNDNSPYKTVQPFFSVGIGIGF